MNFNSVKIRTLLTIDFLLQNLLHYYYFTEAFELIMDWFSACMVITEPLILDSKSLIYNKNKMGPKMVPCGQFNPGGIICVLKMLYDKINAAL